VPAPNQGFVAIAAGYCHTLGLKSDGTVVAWGDRTFSQCPPPEPNGGYIAISAAYAQSLCLRGTPSTSVQELGPLGPADSRSVRILSVAPNPFSVVTELLFETQQPAAVSLQVNTVDGRILATVPLGWFHPGSHHVLWDGRDESGTPAASGVYFVRLIGARDGSRARRVVLVR